MSASSTVTCPGCGGPKRWRQPVCARCWRKLPPALRSALMSELVGPDHAAGRAHVLATVLSHG